MTTTIDLAPAAERMTRLLAAVDDDQLGAPTPCPDYTLGDLADHIGGLTLAFTAAAARGAGGDGGQGPSGDGPSGDASRLEPGWRERVTRDLDALVTAWRDPAAWTGMTRAGGIDLPGEVAGLVALDELVLHGWDVARAIGQPYEIDDASLAAVHGFVSRFSGPGREESRKGLFGPVVPVDDGAPLLDRVVGLAGRDPAWGAA